MDALDAVSRRLGRAHIRPRPGPERRYYYRQADFNGPVWRAIREEAERGRGVASTILDGVTLDRVLPPPSVDVVWANPFAEGAGARALVGFLLWAQEYLA